MPVAVTIELGLGSLLVYGLPFIIVVGWFSSRLLGVHRGWGRSLVAGFFGWVGGVAVAAVIENHDVRTTGATRGHPPARTLLRRADLDVRRADPRRDPQAEAGEAPPTALVAPPDQHGQAAAGTARSLPRDPALRAPPRPPALRVGRRSWSRPEFARRLRLTLEDCGGMFVKFGQIASTRNDLLPEVITTELAQLQSAARPVPADEVRAGRSSRSSARRSRRTSRRSTSSRSRPRRSARRTARCSRPASTSW